MDMAFLKDVAQVLYYASLSVTGPLALLGYWRAKLKEQREREYRAYDELDNKYLEYQKLALAHDLDLVEAPDASLALGNDPRLKRELVTASCGFALFQRAYLMFHDQTGEFKARQWRGWDRLLGSFLSRPNVRHAWQVCKEHFDTGFLAVVDARLLAALQQAGADPAVVHAFRETGVLVEDANEHRVSEPDLAAWRAALDGHRRRAG
jgi:hypothetical protein